ncbi:hypothetical protein OIV83_005894 [Microbotryomycetes sp. JL201]|nr:hypothetical protein OIV83_005894 [Microbotryomycetes sp. JL201]
MPKKERLSLQESGPHSIPTFFDACSSGSFLNDVLAAGTPVADDSGSNPRLSGSQASTPALSDCATLSESEEAHQSQPPQRASQDDADEDETVYGKPEKSLPSMRYTQLAATSVHLSPTRLSQISPLDPPLLPLGFRGVSLLQKTVKQLRHAQEDGDGQLRYLLLKHQIAIRLQKGVTGAELMELEQGSTALHTSGAAMQPVPMLDNVLASIRTGLRDHDTQTHRPSNAAYTLPAKAGRCLLRSSTMHVLTDEEPTWESVNVVWAQQDRPHRLIGLAALELSSEIDTVEAST